MLRQRVECLQQVVARVVTEAVDQIEVAKAQANRLLLLALARNLPQRQQARPQPESRKRTRLLRSDQTRTALRVPAMATPECRGRECRPVSESGHWCLPRSPSRNSQSSLVSQTA